MNAPPSLSPAERLQPLLRTVRPLAVAVSGGVDSMTLASLAQRILGQEVTMFHARSPAVPPAASARVEKQAAKEGWALSLIDAGEFADARYRANPLNRCFYCKTNLYGAIAAHTSATIASGTNADDLTDFRPGLEAARAHGVRHPYVEAGLDKAAVRALARTLGLDSIAELPAAPCLSSRIETGLPIEESWLGLIDAVETMVRGRLGAAIVRCRVRREGLVIELDDGSLGKLGMTARAALAAEIGQAAKDHGLSAPLAFAHYKMGGAFLRAEADPT
jgi:uncharacterized protein